MLDLLKHNPRCSLVSINWCFVNIIYTSAVLYAIVVPKPVVRLTSDTPNPILSGSHFSLTCSLELSPVVEVPENVTMVFSGPNQKITFSSTNPVRKSLGRYIISSNTLELIESADSGDYTCTVNVGNEVEVSANVSIIIGMS